MTPSHPGPEPALRLPASREIATGRGIFPPVPPHSPSAPRYALLTLSEQAVLYSFTVIHPAPKTGQPPFTLAYADFPEQVRVFGPLSLPGDAAPRIGMALRVLGTPEAYRFVPAEESMA